MEDVIEVNGGRAGAKINLTIDLAPDDCFMMCKQLFQRLTLPEIEELLSEYIEENGDVIKLNKDK